MLNCYFTLSYPKLSKTLKDEIESLKRKLAEIAGSTDSTSNVPAKEAAATEDDSESSGDESSEEEDIPRKKRVRRFPYDDEIVRRRTIRSLRYILFSLHFIVG